jgi:hypothetical protein
VDQSALDELSASVERLVALARSIDFDLLHGNGEPIGQLVTEARFFADLTDHEDAFDLSQSLMQQLRRRRNLPAGES